MKMILIDPNINSYALMPTLSLAYLKGYIIKKTKHDAKIIDLVFHKKNWEKYILEKISVEKPDLIGFSVMSFNYKEALKIADFIKKNFDIKIIFGGVHVILCPEDVIKNKEIDIICLTEGEEVLKELLDNNLNCKDVKGIWYKENGKIIKNKNRLLVEDLGILAFPDFSDFDIDKYFGISNFHFPIMATRGCPYYCTYCSNLAISRNLEGKYVRSRSADNVIKEIELRISQYKKKGLKFLYFYDDTFIINKDFVIDFCKKFKEKGFDKILRWNVNVRANLVTDELIKTMKDAGCIEARMGVESANDYIRNDIYNKNITKKQLYDAFKIIKDNGLNLRLYFIIGAPYETIEMMHESFNMAKESNADEFIFGQLLPLPGTEIKNLCEKENLIENPDDKIISPVIKTKFTSENQIKKFCSKLRFFTIQKYTHEGFKYKGIFFLWDITTFLFYYKYKYNLNLKQILRWNIQRYKNSTL